MIRNFWTPERVEILRIGIADGHSAGQIARQIGDGATRNGVIGKAHRCGFCWSDPRSAGPAPDLSPPPPEPVKATPIRIEPELGKDPRLCVHPGCGNTRMAQNLHHLCQIHDQERITAKRNAA